MPRQRLKVATAASHGIDHSLLAILGGLTILGLCLLTLLGATSASSRRPSAAAGRPAAIPDFGN